MKRNTEAGFTVLELLISLAILAMIAATLATTISSGAQLWKRSATMPDREQAIVLRAKLRTWIETAVPPERLDLQQDFTGTATRMRFLTSTDLPNERGGEATWITVIVDESEPALSVVLETVTASGQIREVEERDLINGQGRLLYFDGGSQNWVQVWEAADRLPDLVAIEAVPERAEDWPPFVVGPVLR
ncbi:MAG: prepilin-type N-terminal cleavage/methylation domain-containing protein [Pseudomonadota bacterium]